MAKPMIRQMVVLFRRAVPSGKCRIVLHPKVSVSFCYCYEQARGYWLIAGVGVASVAYIGDV